MNSPEKKQTQSTDDNKYVDRNPGKNKEIGVFINAFEESLKKQPPENLQEQNLRPFLDGSRDLEKQQQPDNLQKEPFIFLLHGLSGVGKHEFLLHLQDNNLNQKDQGTHQKCKNPIFIDLSFDQIGTPRTPLEFMNYIANDLENRNLFTDHELKNSHKSRTHFEHVYPFHNSTFREVYDLYQSKLWELRTNARKGEDAVSKEQIESVARLAELGGKVIAPSIALALGVPELMPVALSIATRVSQTTPNIAIDLLTVKDALLNKHKATEDEKIRKLLLAPLTYLTPLFIDLLIIASRECSIFLVLEKYEKTNPPGQMTSDLNDWFCQCLLSSQSRLLNSKVLHKVRIIISGKNKLTKQECWANLYHYRRAALIELHLKPFTEEDAKEYIKRHIENKDKTLTSQEQKRYLESAKGHAKYLKLICDELNKPAEPDESIINQEVSNIFLEGLSDNQRYIVQILACCRWFDRQLIRGPIQNFIESLGLALAPSSEPELKKSLYLNAFEWLLQQHFVDFDQDRYHLHDLVRQVLQRRLFQENRELFYQVHDHLANYFKERADNLRQEKPQFTKYSDLEWCEYTGEYLYHACFAQQVDYQKWFIYHLFASIYLRQPDIMKIAFKEIRDEFSLSYHPLLQSPTRNFLKTLEFIIQYDWVAFELNHETDFGKYRAKIEAAVQLVKNQIRDLPDGIGTVAALEYIVKNFPLNATKSERSEWEQRLRDAIEHTADKIDPEFSSQLFMQSVCWQAGHDDNARRWCEQALDYKSDNANAWFKQGQILKQQGDDQLHQNHVDKAQECYEAALKSYKTALKIQSYDHRYWQGRGEVLECLGKILQNRSPGQYRRQIPYGSCDINDENFEKTSLGMLLQQAAYYQQAFDSYAIALRFRSQDKGLSKKCHATRMDCDTAIDKFHDSVSTSKTSEQNSSNDNPPTYGELIAKGDNIRASGKDLKSAFEFYTLAIRQKPEYPWGWYSRGLAYAKQAKYKIDDQQKSDDYSNAIQDYDKALALKADLTWAFYDKGIAFHELAGLQQNQQEQAELGWAEAKPEYEQALDNFDQAIRIDPDYEDAWYRRGLTLTGLKRYEEAIASYDKAIECAERNVRQDETQSIAGSSLRPKNQRQAWYWYDRGKAYAELATFEEAIASYEKAIADNEKYYDAHHQLGITLRNIGEHNKAADTFLKVIDLAKKELERKKDDFWQVKLADAYYDYAESCKGMKDLTYCDQPAATAITNYCEALRRNPKHEDACKHLEEMLRAQSYELAQYEEAIKTFESILKKLDEDKDSKQCYGVRLALIRSSLKIKDSFYLHKARDIYSTLIKRSPTQFKEEEDFQNIDKELEQQLHFKQ
jgi:tetratricopeptide (TPR) repeat protein